ncbi:hypothetical protein [uncultured Abyssibacter sp.]|uniref:hypothetical protein n=1 Tax=uncultured Abyssibacter sp. TaxID=2320202 RepID=UPI0032B2DD2D|tara:strand:- start:413 stop:742 length:330 start_codon:yes stop_codon:yes gene_type:complete
MKSHRYISALLLLLFPAIAFSVGYWLADIEKQAARASVVALVESQAEADEHTTRYLLAAASALANGDEVIAREMLEARLRSKLRGASGALAEEGLEYQRVHCSDKCLGI